ncbi:immunoglobulin mu Fc receptor-like [Trachinotus anak]|uniref:immunoglobulin mu Fc receptor-like n=1 Tax=Trachinotus anak TaxID=443729 RepID=UPI0039F1AFE3
MKVHHTVICCFFLTLQDVETKVFNVGSGVLTGTEGGSITVKCSFPLSGRKKYFCKEECEKQDILIETEGVRARRGRYRIGYKERFFPTKSTLLYVTITQLMKSDSGWYSCGITRPFAPDLYEEFEIRVTDAPIISKPNLVLRPLPTSLPSSSTPTTTTQSLNSSVGSSSFSSAPETTKQPEASPAGSGFFLVPVVCVSVVIVVVLLLVLLLLYKKKIKGCCGLNTRGNSDHTNIQCVTYENWPPASTCEDSTYQSLHPATRDHDQIYATLT